MNSYLELIEILTCEYDYYNQLLNIAKKKKEALINNRTDKLMEFLKEDRNIISEIKDLEKKRKKIIGKLSTKYQLENNMELSYSYIISSAAEKWQKKLILIRNNLLEVIEEFHNQNEQIRYLVEEAVKINEFSLKTLLQNIENDNNTYNNSQNTPLLLNKRG